MNIRKAHFIGIGGVGMSATAKLLQDAGVVVSGSDEEVYPPVSDFLDEQHISWKSPYAVLNIPTDADAIIIGKNAKLVAETNPEVASAFASGKKILSFPDVLAQLSEGKETIVVAGSYGKSTSSALLAHCLQNAGLSPSYFIGAIPLTPAVSAQMGTDGTFVLEGDEYPSSNTDPRAKFLHYHPSHLLITPLAHDHFNIFPTPQDYIKPFYELIQLPPQNATIVVCIEGPLSRDFVANCGRTVITYGVHEGDFHAENIVYGEKTTFSLAHGNAELLQLETTQLGEHSIQNIVGVGAFLLSRNLLTPRQFAIAVASFKGIKRRLDKKSDKTSIPIFEGFGSSYEKLRSAIAAMKKHFPERRLVVVFEPNTFSWRNRESLSWYDSVFEGAAKVYIFNPPHDGKETQLSTEEIAQRVKTSGIEATAIETSQQALEQLQSELQATDCILLSSSGAMGGLIESISRLAEQKFPLAL